MSIGEFKYHRRKTGGELRPYVEGEDLTGVSISDVDEKNGSPRAGDMIARNPHNHKDRWLVSEGYFKDNYEQEGEWIKDE